ncbi:MAG: IS110 family transposase [candidate division Zixibacteria bacterium]|nr:IS110 family transposase [candidate division Zixibacteria bacterium]
MKNAQTDWTGQTLYAGIDLHKKKWVISVRTRDLYLKTFVTNSDQEVLLKSFRNNWPGAEIIAVYEAGCFGYHLSKFLNNNAIKTIVVAPHTIPVAPGLFVKTDKLDSKKLALELAKGSLKGIYQPPSQQLYDRGLLRKRRQLIKRKVQVQLQLKSDLLFYGIETNVNEARYWSKKAYQELRDIEFDNEYFKKVFLLILKEYEELIERIKEIDGLLDELSKLNKYRKQFELLRTIPGIGKLAALNIILEIGDIKRFNSADKFASYLGLTPSERSSGETKWIGSLTGMGQSILRTLFIESSWAAIKKDPALLKKYQRLTAKKMPAKAIVAVAKSLANRTRKVLIDEEPYVIGIVR